MIFEKYNLLSNWSLKYYNYMTKWSHKFNGKTNLLYFFYIFWDKIWIFHLSKLICHHHTFRNQNEHLTILNDLCKGHKYKKKKDSQVEYWSMIDQVVSFFCSSLCVFLPNLLRNSSLVSLRLTTCWYQVTSFIAMRIIIFISLS